MFSRVATKAVGRSFSTSTSASAKVAVLGAAGGIGQPLGLLLKMNPNVKELALFDIVNTPGVAADLSHISTPAKVTGYTGNDELGDCLKGCDVVLIPAGVPRKPGMTRDDLFNTNASIIATLAQGCAEHCPEAKVGIIANPVNSTLPITVEMFKRAGVYNPKKLFGVTTLDVLRAECFVSEAQGWDVQGTKVTVVGGHAGTTILPLLSQVDGAVWNADQLGKLTHRIQFGGDEVVQAKDGAGSATLSMAVAAARFGDELIRAQNGEKGIVTCTMVESNVTSAPYFASPVELGPDGVEKVHGLGELSEFEKQGLEAMLPDLEKQIQKGIDFAKSF